MTTVLVTGIGGPAGRSLASQLRRRGFAEPGSSVVGVDARRATDTDATYTRTVPFAAAPDFVPALRDVIELVRADLVIPTVSEELPIVAAAARLLDAHGARIAVGGPAAMSVAADKLFTMWALARANVPVPRFAPASDFRSAAEAMRALGGPVVVKPRVSRGGRDVVLFERDAEQGWPSAPERLLVQRFAPGVEYSPQAFRAGHESALVVLEKTRLRHGRMGNADAAERREGGAVAHVAHVASAALDALGVEGAADIDIRIDDDGVPVVLEVNARFGALSAHAPEVLDAALTHYLPGSWPGPRPGPRRGERPAERAAERPGE
jgi:carbamoyl-phosphate synthase large subunit